MFVLLCRFLLNVVERSWLILFLYFVIFLVVVLCYVKSFVWEVFRWWYCMVCRLNVVIIGRWLDVSENEFFMYVR